MAAAAHINQYLLFVVSVSISRARLTVTAESFSLCDLAHEKRLALLQIRWETLCLDNLDGLADGLGLLRADGLALLLDGARHASVVALERAAELGVGLALVVKVDGVCWGESADAVNEGVLTYPEGL